MSINVGNRCDFLSKRNIMKKQSNNYVCIMNMREYKQHLMTNITHTEFKKHTYVTYIFRSKRMSQIL